MSNVINLSLVCRCCVSPAQTGGLLSELVFCLSEKGYLAERDCGASWSLSLSEKG